MKDYLIGLGYTCALVFGALLLLIVFLPAPWLVAAVSERLTTLEAWAARREWCHKTLREAIDAGGGGPTGSKV